MLNTLSAGLSGVNADCEVQHPQARAKTAEPGTKGAGYSKVKGRAPC